MTYFEKFTEQIRIVMKRSGFEIAKFKIDRFPVLISNIDAVLKTLSPPILELCLNSTFLTASECLVLSENP